MKYLSLAFLICPFAHSLITIELPTQLSQKTPQVSYANAAKDWDVTSDLQAQQKLLLAGMRELSTDERKHPSINMDTLNALDARIKDNTQKALLIALAAEILEVSSQVETLQKEFAQHDSDFTTKKAITSQRKNSLDIFVNRKQALLKELGEVSSEIEKRKPAAHRLSKELAAQEGLRNNLEIKLKETSAYLEKTKKAHAKLSPSSGLWALLGY